MNLVHRNDSEQTVHFIIATYRVAEQEITSDVKDRNALYNSLNNYVNHLLMNNQRTQPGYHPLTDCDANTFEAKAGDVCRGTATYRADQVGVFQILALADLQFADGTTCQVSSNKVEVAVLPIQEFARVQPKTP